MWYYTDAVQKSESDQIVVIDGPESLACAEEGPYGLLIFNSFYNGPGFAKLVTASVFTERVRVIFQLPTNLNTVAPSSMSVRREGCHEYWNG